MFKTVGNYLQLIRFFNQTGTIFLFIPCLLGLTYANALTGWNVMFFLISAFFARSCGCILNDIADSKIDSQIPTTKSRVIASGMISKKNALFFFIFLVFVSFPLVFAFSRHILPPLILIGILVLIYPYSKRFFQVPQVFLGIVYASGFVIACCHGLKKSLFELDLQIFAIYLAFVLWVIFYDTIYAKRDLQFDKIQNVNSSAVFFAKILILLKFQNINENDRINYCLIVIAIVSNAILFCVKPALLPLLINIYLQISSVFQKPSDGFKSNVLCVIPLMFWFA